MKTKYRKVVTTILLLSSLSSWAQSTQTFTLKSADLGGQASLEQVFNGFGCTGKNISPQLSWTNPPKGTQSYALTMYDPDAPTGSGWWHWVVFNIPSNISELKAGAGNVENKMLPSEAVQSMTDFGSIGYGGPCPPEGHGFHRYIITIYALKVPKLDLDKNAMPALVGYMLNMHSLEKASLMFYYKR